MNNIAQKIAIQTAMQMPASSGDAFPVFLLSDEIKALVLLHNPEVNIVYIVELPRAWHMYISTTNGLYTRLAIPHQ